MKKKALGRGIDALIPGSVDVPIYAEKGDTMVTLNPVDVSPNPFQPREIFDHAELEELCASIKDSGLIQPILVRKGHAGYQLIAGERRLKASLMAGLKKIPAVVKNVDDEDMLKLGLLENIQRKNLNPIEEAKAYNELVDQFGYTQKMLSEKLGKKRSTIANSLRLLGLPEDIQAEVSNGNISAGHARVLLAIDDAKDMRELAMKIIKEQISVRDAEKYLKTLQKKKIGKKKRILPDPIVREAEEQLMRSIGLKVALKVDKKGAGKLTINFAKTDELNRLLEMFDVDLG